MCAFFELAIPALRTNPTNNCTSQQRYTCTYIYIMNLGISIAMKC